MASDAQCQSSQIRAQTLRQLVRHIDRCLDNQRQSRHRCCVTLRHALSARLSLLCGRRYGNYLLGLYLGLKACYLINAAGQLFLLDAFLSMDYHLYGWQVLKEMHSGKDYTPSRRFPRVTMCDLEIRQMSNVHRHSVQCVLPLNLFNEKIYLVLWFWLLGLALLTAFSLLWWIRTSVFPAARLTYIRHFLGPGLRDKGPEKKLVRRFVLDYLRHDGLLTLRLVQANSSHVLVSDIVWGLWDTFRKKRFLQVRSTPLPSTPLSSMSSPLPPQNEDSEGEDVFV